MDCRDASSNGNAADRAFHTIKIDVELLVYGQ
jgi:hypothetical protein